MKLKRHVAPAGGAVAEAIENWVADMFVT